MRTLIPILILTALLGIVACTPEEAPPGPTITQYYVRATVGSVEFNATHSVVASVNGAFLNIRGSAGAGFPSMTISLENATLGTNVIGGNSASQVVWTASDAADPAVTYRAALGVGSGTVTLSRFDEKVEGTFSVVARNSVKDSVVITQGTFYAHLQP